MAGPSEYDRKLAAIDDLAACTMVALRNLQWAGEHRNPETVRGPLNEYVAAVMRAAEIE